MPTFKTKHPKEHKKQQHCPTCNRYVKYNDTIHDYICAKCVELATDKDGRPIIFLSITKEGRGCQGRYSDSDNLYRSFICFIKEIKCSVQELPGSGIFIRPVLRKRKLK
ncbi:MAG: hypothetical protein EOP48_30035 [Sphingobacteriales bacterium]|nr:MAG: hypothetical protein EOP48_30035 [Sphingobacteriales bacterium]